MSAKLKKRLREAQRVWQDEAKNPDIEGMPGFMPGVVKGFSETLRIVKEFQREELSKTLPKRRSMSRLSAMILYHACRQAYGRLRYSDRVGAMRALKRVLDKTNS